MPLPPPVPPSDSLPDDVLDALRRGRKIEAIKLLREGRGIGLKEAKETIDAYADTRPSGSMPGPATAPRPSFRSLFVPALVLGAIVWAMVNVVPPIGSLIVLVNRDGYGATTFTVERLLHTDDGDGLFWGFEGRVPDGPVRLYAPELADARALGYRRLTERFPAGTGIPVWYNPTVTDTLFQARTLRVIVRGGDLVEPEMNRIGWWLGYCLAPLVMVLLVVGLRERRDRDRRPVQPAT